jgi:hypothetical protein
MAAVPFHVCDPGVLGLIFSLLGQVEKHIEAREIVVTLNHRSRLLSLNRIELLNGVQKFTKEPLLVCTKRNPRDPCPHGFVVDVGR